MIRQSVQFVGLIVVACVLGVVATGFAWVMYLIVGDRLPRAAEVFVAEEYVPADLVVSVAEASPGTEATVSAVWAAWAQGGEEAGGRMLSGTEEKMKGLEPKYVRLDHIFDDDYYGVYQGSGSYDFNKLDAIVEDIEQMGAKPFFALGYMPSGIADSKIDQPRDWGEWKGLVKALIRHYLVVMARILVMCIMRCGTSRIWSLLVSGIMVVGRAICSCIGGPAKLLGSFAVRVGYRSLSLEGRGLRLCIRIGWWLW
jgi:hypothetical protein